MNIKIKNCIDCNAHKILTDPDPTDWFCDDDVKVICTASKDNKSITCACRPHRVRQESEIPKWCPKSK